MGNITNINYMTRAFSNVAKHFVGNRISVLAARSPGITLTDEQIKELEDILKKSKETGSKRTVGK